MREPYPRGLKPNVKLARLDDAYARTLSTGIETDLAVS